MMQRYGDLTRDVFSDRRRLDAAVAILPLGAMEHHGAHLPVATDTILAEEILDRCADQLRMNDHVDAIRFPTLWLGVSIEHEHLPGTLSCAAQSFISAIDAVAQGLKRQGIIRLILLNAHGGNVASARIAALEARKRYEMLVASAHWMDFGLPDTLELPGEPRLDAHGGWMETSMMLAAAPQLVKPPLPAGQPAVAPASQLFPSGPVHWGWLADDISSSGVIGRPDQATAAIGEAVLDHAAAGLANLVVDVAGAEWPIAG